MRYDHMGSGAVVRGPSALSADVGPTENDSVISIRPYKGTTQDVGEPSPKLMRRFLNPILTLFSQGPRPLITCAERCPHFLFSFLALFDQPLAFDPHGAFYLCL